MARAHAGELIKCIKLFSQKISFLPEVKRTNDIIYYCNRQVVLERVREKVEIPLIVTTP
jgi:hypothetical protein